MRRGRGAIRSTPPHSVLQTMPHVAHLCERRAVAVAARLPSARVIIGLTRSDGGHHGLHERLGRDPLVRCAEDGVVTSFLSSLRHGERPLHAQVGEETIEHVLEGITQEERRARRDELVR